jgi:DNA (cytosine-5)-methyltransferase 1
VAIDSNPNCLDVYRHNLSCLKAYPNNMLNILDGEIGRKPTLRERGFLKYARKITFLLSGPPCEGNSDLNNHTRRKDPRNLLYKRVARFAQLVRPEHLLVENVPNVVHGKEKAVTITIEVLRDLGYSLDTGIVDVSQLGVPQKRKRHVTVASLTREVSVTEIIQQYLVKPPRSVWWAIDDLENASPSDAYDEASHQSRENITRMRYLHANHLLDLPDRLRPKCHKENDHSYRSMYGRLDKNRPAQTITGGFGSPGQGRFVHPSRVRTLTPHEAARLQFFPDYFEFSPSQNRVELASMIGNAAPSRLGYVFCLELLA